jgi:hypothetical protein
LYGNKKQFPHYMKKIVVTVLLAALAQGTYAQTRTGRRAPQKAAPQKEVKAPAGKHTDMIVPAVRFANTITVQDLSRHLHIVASDSMEGRETGERGQKMAAEYIASQFNRIGLKPVSRLNDAPSYYQRFDLHRKQWGEVYMTINGKRKAFLQDFYAMGDFSIPEEVSYDVAFAGFGIDDEKYSDYKTFNATNKFVVMLAGEPTNAEGKSLITGTETASAWAKSWQKKAAAAKENGARACFIVVNDSNDQFLKQLSLYRNYLTKPSLGLPKDEAVSEFGVFFIPMSMAAEMLNTTEARLLQLREPVQPAGKSARKVKGIAASSANVALKAEKLFTPVATENILGLVEGTDKKDEIIVITAHYDHVGTSNGLVFNGADDDGSGTVAVLELAEAFARAKAEGHGPRRSILFMTVTGEEKGLLGSEYYSKNPVFPLAQTITNLNIDMIGRIDQKHEGNPDYVYIIGSDMLSTELHRINEQANATYSKLELDYTYNGTEDPNRYYYRSDHYNFAKNNIPVIFYFNGVHEDYHQHTDTVDKINFEKMEKITRLVFYTAWDVANREERIKVDVKQ